MPTAPMSRAPRRSAAPRCVGISPGSYVDKQYTILNATGGVSGTFNPAVNTNMPANFHPTLELRRQQRLSEHRRWISFRRAASTVNQQNVANAMTNFFNSDRRHSAGVRALVAGGADAGLRRTAPASQQTTFKAMNCSSAC